MKPLEDTICSPFPRIVIDLLVLQVYTSRGYNGAGSSMWRQRSVSLSTVSEAGPHTVFEERIGILSKAQ